jgi:Asp/Glu/hydantoin racemase
MDNSNVHILEGVEAILVCCYSQHPLVPALRLMLAQSQRHSVVVTGIFEASIATCLQAIDINEKFGIVSTGEQWQGIMNAALAGLLGSASSARYAGTETTALNATELHTTSRAEVDRRMKDATKRLLSRGARAICLGCAGMAGMDRTVREACIEHLGENDGRRIMIIDGVVSGLNYLQGMLRAKNLERLSAAQT